MWHYLRQGKVMKTLSWCEGWETAFAHAQNAKSSSGIGVSMHNWTSLGWYKWEIQRNSDFPLEPSLRKSRVTQLVLKVSEINRLKNSTLTVLPSFICMLGKLCLDGAWRINEIPFGSSRKKSVKSSFQCTKQEICCCRRGKNKKSRQEGRIKGKNKENFSCSLLHLLPCSYKETGLFQATLATFSSRWERQNRVLQAVWPFCLVLVYLFFLQSRSLRKMLMVGQVSKARRWLHGVAKNRATPCTKEVRNLLFCEIKVVWGLETRGLDWEATFFIWTT